MSQEFKQIKKEEKEYYDNLFVHLIASGNPQYKNLFFKRKLLKNNRRLILLPKRGEIIKGKIIY